jgi:hypothetical protein
MVAKMREERNQARIRQLGVDLDNNIPSTQASVVTKTLLANGTASGALSGITSPNGNVYTLPAWAINEQDGLLVEPIPSGYYDPFGPGFQQTAATESGDITPILTGLPNPVVSTLVPAGPVIEPTVSDIVIIAAPPEFNPSNLPPNLDPNYTNSTMLPATYSIADAIDKVIECNCDCWVH